MSFIAERQLLGTILARGLTPDASDAMESLDEKAFQETGHGKLFVAMQTIYRSGMPMNVRTLLGKWPELYELGTSMTQDEVSVNAIERLHKAVKTSYASRLMISMLHKASEQLQRDPLALSDVTMRLEANISTLDTDSGNSEPSHMKSYANAYVTLLEQRENGLDSAIGIDIGIDCNINRTDLIVVGGQPSMGKTALCLYCANYVADQSTPDKPKEVLLFSLEMEGIQIFEREVSRNGKIPISKLKQQNKTDSDWASTTTGVGISSNKDIWIDDGARLDLLTLKNKSRRFKAKHPGLSLIIVDYLTLMDLPGADRRDLSVGEVTRQCKMLAKELKTPVMLLSQLSRDAAKAKREPECSDLRDSGAIEQDADKIIFPYREEVHNEQSPNKGLAKILKRKVRDGEPGAYLMGFKYGNFYKVENPTWQDSEQTKGGSFEF